MRDDTQPAPEAGQPQTTAEPASDISSVVGSIAGHAATPEAKPAPDARAGSLRPAWPLRLGQGATQARRYALAARLVATACALLYFYVAWGPLADVITSGDLRNGLSGPQLGFSLTAAELGAPPLHALFGADFFGPWSMLTVAGLLLSPLLWQTTTRWLQWLALALYTCWFVLMSVVFIATAQLILGDIPAQLKAGAGPYKFTPYPYPQLFAIYSIKPAYGLWLALLGGLLGLAALALAGVAIVTRRRASRPVTPTIQGEIVTPGVSPTRSLPGVGAITGGLILWAWGFFALPWATYNCSAPVLIGVCHGVSVNYALQYGLGGLRAYIEPSAGMIAITGLLLIGAALILIAIWRRDITRTLCAWASAWAVLALVCAIMGVVGVQQVIHNAPSVGLPTGDWRADQGVLVVFLALLLVGIGLIPLWAVAVRAAQRREAARRAAAGGV
ncbi:MAG TPA: hypothetical protein VF725_11675 [Ktedonobacterales bacterium]